MEEIKCCLLVRWDNLYKLQQGSTLSLSAISILEVKKKPTVFPC